MRLGVTCVAYIGTYNPQDLYYTLKFQSGFALDRLTLASCRSIQAVLWQ